MPPHRTKHDDDRLPVGNAAARASSSARWWGRRCGRKSAAIRTASARPASPPSSRPRFWGVPARTTIACGAGCHERGGQTVSRSPANTAAAASMPSPKTARPAGLHGAGGRRRGT
jgi:hypothetical protein